MLINYGSFMYFFYIFFALGLCAALYFIFRKKSEKAKKILVFSLTVVNFLQHIFKNLIYPQYRDWGFSYANTIYNMCAFLIVISPFVFIFGKGLMKDFLTYIGSVAGIIAICVPYWYIGGSAFGWEQYRFYICHTILFVSSMLPALLDLHKLNYKNFYKIPFIFFLAIIIMTFNDIAIISLGLYGDLSLTDLYGALYALNPCWSFHPNESFGVLNKILCVLSPNAFLGNADGKNYVPLLWYAVPMYLLITVLSFIIGAICDKETFKNDFSKFRHRVAQIYKKIKNKAQK